MATSKPPRRRRERKLPVQQLCILAICRFADPIAGTSLFPYLPEMILSFGIAQDQVARWAGICSAVFSLCQAAMAIPWGRFSDRRGRKPAILLGLACTMFATLLWGFSTSLPMAIVARGFSGAGNGMVGIIRTTVAELVPFKELQPRAFSLMPLVWSIGSIFGPSFGGLLANPLDVRPGQTFDHPSLLQRFPYALPNIIAACVYVFGLAIGVLFLEETLASIQTRDYGLRLGDRIKWLFKRYISWLLSLFRRHGKQTDGEASDERAPLLKPSEDEEDQSPKPDQPKLPPPSYREVLTRQACLNLLAYTLLALHNVGAEQLFPVFFQYPPIESKSQATPTAILASDNPLRFAGGFGLTHYQIGLISTVYGICGMFIQFFIFPPVARRFGVLRCIRVCACTFPIAYFLMPFTALLPTRNARVGVFFTLMMVKLTCSLFAVPSTTITLTNSAPSVRVLGTLNGFATSFSALGRAAGPAISGSVFTLGVQRGYIIAPFWTLCLLAIIAAVPAFFMVEGDGFGGDDDDEIVSDEEQDDTDDNDDDDGEGHADIEQQDRETLLLAESEAQAMGKPGPALVASHAGGGTGEAAFGNSSSGGMDPLARTTTEISSVSLGSDEYSSPETSRRTSAADDRAGKGIPIRRGSRRVARRTSAPFGMGGADIGRRYGSVVGQSWGSHDGLHG